MSSNEPTAVPELGLRADIRAEGSATVVELQGEADASTHPVLVEVIARVIAGADGAVIVDLSRTSFLDVDGARTISRAASFLLARDRELRLRSPSRIAVRTLDLFGLGGLIEAEEAVSAQSVNG